MIWFLLLIELVDETINGDKHDWVSIARLFLMTTLAFVFGFMTGNLWIGVHYIVLRFGIFDVSIALLRGQKWWYLGDTSIYDRILKFFNRWVLLTIRVVCVTFIIYNEYQK